MLQCNIVEISGTAPYWLKIHLDNVLYSGAVTPRPKFPEPNGSTITVYFRQGFPKQGPMEPKDGEEVILGVKHYTVGAKTTPFWGNDGQYFYKKKGNFYGPNGFQLGIAT